MSSRALPSVILFLIASSVGSAQAPTDSAEARVRGVAGCYELTVSEWSPADRNAAYHRIPGRIRLDTVRAALGRGRVLSPNIAYPHHGAFPGTPNWNTTGDTLLLVWSNGFQLTIVKLENRDSVWSGEAVAESDDRPIPPQPLPRARVVARRAPCR